MMKFPISRSLSPELQKGQKADNKRISSPNKCNHKEQPPVTHHWKLPHSFLSSHILQSFDFLLLFFFWVGIILSSLQLYVSLSNSRRKRFARGKGKKDIILLLNGWKSFLFSKRHEKIDKHNLVPFLFCDFVSLLISDWEVDPVTEGGAHLMSHILKTSKAPSDEQLLLKIGIISPSM